MDINNRNTSRLRAPFLRSACITIMWIVLTAVVVRQCKMDELGEIVRDMDRRIQRIEERPAVRITVDDDGKAVINGND